MSKLQKLIKRLFLIAKFALSNLLLPFFSILLSLEVINFYGKELWGEFVKLFLIVNICTSFLSWGNKDYLLRKFSERPIDISSNWKESLLTRSVLLLIVIPVLLGFTIDAGYKVLICSWVLIRFLYLSYDSIIIYKKMFFYSVLAETIGFILITIFILTHASQIELQELLFCFLVADTIKLVIIWLLLREKNLKFANWNYNSSFFKAAFPFFIISFSGLLQSRADQLCVNTLLTPPEIAEYQVLMNFLLYATAIPTYFIIPYLKNYYRLKDVYFKKLAQYFLLIGLIIIPLILVLIYFTMDILYRFKLPVNLLLYGGLFLLPIFYYSSIVYLLFKLKKQMIVVTVVGIGILLNIGLCLIFIPAYRMNGALISAAVSQWIMFFIFLSLQKHFLGEKNQHVIIN